MTLATAESFASLDSLTPRQRKYYREGMRHGRETGVGAGHAAALRRSIASALKLPEEEAVHRVVREYHQRLDAMPSTTAYPELRGMRECVLAYNRGIVDATGAAEQDVIVNINFLHTCTAALQRSSALHAGSNLSDAPPGCTLVYFPTSDRGPLVANNNDATANYAHRNDPAWIVANRAGLILGTVSSGIFDDELSPESFPAPVFLMAQEMCGTTSEAVELLTRLNLFWGPCNALVADCRGNSAVIEKSTCRFAVRPSPDGFAATTEMAAEDPTFKRYLWQTRDRSLRARGMTHDSPDMAYWKACERRSARLLNLVDHARLDPQLAAMERIIYDHTGAPDQVHMDGSKCHPDQEAGEWSLRTTIWAINERRAQSSYAEPPVSGHLTARQWKAFDEIDYTF